MEGDDKASKIFRKVICISIHSLRMEGDSGMTFAQICDDLFQSTPSAWRETYETYDGIQAAVIFQSTPSAWRETAEQAKSESSKQTISIHSLRMEGDLYQSDLCRSWGISIHSLRMEGDRSLFRRTVGKAVISIHSLRMEGD